MKKFLLSALFALLTASMVHAGGFNSQTTKTSIVDALKLPDDSYVTIQGNIVKKISSDKYTFKDSTGTMTVEIDNDKWGTLEATDKDLLELTGEIEKKFNSTHLDVDNVKKIK